MSSDNTTGTFLLHLHKVLQVDMDLPGKSFHYDIKDWNHGMPCWLSQTWQYVSEQKIKITTNIPMLAPQCINDQFLMLKFWQHRYKGTQLELLNKCWLWLQVITLADIMNGQGMELLTPMLMGSNEIALPSWWWWPQKGWPSQKGWTCGKKQQPNASLPVPTQNQLTHWECGQTPFQIWNGNGTPWRTD